MNALNVLYIGECMAMLTVRNLPDEVHRALKIRAAQKGRSTEAEVREILAVAVKPENRLLMGDFLSKLGRDAGLTDKELDQINGLRSRKPAKPMSIK
jgi:antitoxin FitA